MKMHYKRSATGYLVTAYNDSNIEWVVSTPETITQRFSKSKWTLKGAVEFYIELNKLDTKTPEKSLTE